MHKAISKTDVAELESAAPAIDWPDTVALLAPAARLG